MNLTKSVWAFGFVLVLLVGLTPGTVAWAHDSGVVVIGKCDSDATASSGPPELPQKESGA